MVRIKRTKKAPGMATTPATVHYALAVAPAGNVTAWTANADKAGEFSDDIGAKVREFYLRRENAGELTFEKVKATAPAPTPTPAPTAAPVPPAPIPAPANVPPPAATTQEPAAPDAAHDSEKPEKPGRKAGK